MQVINRTKEQTTLEIVLANGARDSINIQPQSRVTLPQGATLNPDKAVVYARIVKVVEDVAPPATPAPAPEDAEGASNDTVSITETAQK